MQGNLNRARHSMIFTHPPDEDSNDLRSVEHPLKTSMSLRSDRSPFKPWTTRYSRPAYHSTSSQISSMDGPPDRQSIRESSKSPVRDSSGSPISAAMYFRPNKSPMPLHLQHSVSARNLETKSEPASAAIGGHPAQQQSFGNGRKASPRSLSRSPPSSGGRDESPGFNQSRSPGPHSSSPGLDELRSQMTELRGRIVSLKQKATEESARRRSVASRKTPSPLNAADEWHYTREHTRSRNTNSPDRLREGVAKQQQQQHGRLDSQAVDRDGVDREDSPVIPIRSRDEIALDSDDEPQLGDDPDEIEQYLLMRENRTKDEFIRLRMEGLYTEQTRLAEQSFRGQYAIYRREGLIRDDDDFDRDGLGGNGSQPFETASAKSAAEGSSHEDRADAFDYENMFLYSSNAKSYPTPPSETSETSDTSERTTRVTSATFAALPTQSPPQIPAQDSSTSRRAPTLRHTPPSGTGRPRKPSNDISQLHVRSSSVCSTSTFQSFATAIEERGTTPPPGPVAVGIGALNDYTQGLRIQTDFRSPGYMTTADGVSIPPLYNHHQQQQQQQRDQLHHSTSAWLDAATPATAGFEGEDDEDEEDDGRGTPTQTNSLNPPEPWTTSVLLRHSAYTESSASPDPSSVIHSRGPLYHSQHPQQHPQHQHHHPHLSPATATAATSGFSGPAALLLRASVASSMMPIMRPGSEAASTPSHSPRTRSLPSLPSSLAQKEGALHRPLLEELPGQLGAARVGAGAGLGAGNGNGAAGLGGGAVRDGGGMGRDVGVGMGTGVVATSTAPVPAEVMRLLVGGLLEGVQTRLAASSPSSSSRPGTAPGPPTTSASTAAHAASNSVSASGANAAERRQSPNGPLQIAAEDQMLLRTLFVRIGATLVGLDGNVGAGAVGVGGVSRNKYRADVVAATAMLK